MTVLLGGWLAEYTTNTHHQLSNAWYTPAIEILAPHLIWLISLRAPTKGSVNMQMWGRKQVYTLPRMQQIALASFNAKWCQMLLMNIYACEIQCGAISEILDYFSSKWFIYDFIHDCRLCFLLFFIQ